MMGSHPDRKKIVGAAAASRLGVLAAVGVAVYVFESLVPMPLPWARLGLSNVIVTVALFAYGVKDAFLVNLVRIVAGNLILGLVLSPAFIFSVAGSFSALAVMAAVKWRLVPPLSVVGTSCLGAVASNVAQVLVFSAAFAPSAAVRGLVGAFILLGVVVGLLTGFVAAAVLRKVGLAGVSGVH
jgi:heptaprenyl diphosphate synthase